VGAGQAKSLSQQVREQQPGLDLVRENADPSDEEIREGLEGNLCRCTGYQNIVRAVQSAAQAMKPGATAPVDTPTPVAGGQ